MGNTDVWRGKISTFWRACYCMTKRVFPSVQHSRPLDCSYLLNFKATESRSFLKSSIQTLSPLPNNGRSTTEQRSGTTSVWAEPLLNKRRRKWSLVGSWVHEISFSSRRPEFEFELFLYFPCQKIHSDPETININALINKTTEAQNRTILRSNSNRKGAGVLFVTPQKGVIHFSFALRKGCSNNEAEYEVLILIAGLLVVLQMGIKVLMILWEFAVNHSPTLGYIWSMQTRINALPRFLIKMKSLKLWSSLLLRYP